MRSRRTTWILLSLLLLGGAWFFWHQAGRQTQQAQKKSVAKPTVVTVRSASTAPQFLTKPVVAAKAVKAGASVTNKFAYRLSNMGKSIGELERDDRAILLANAFIDTSQPLNLAIPSNLKSKGDPGAYIVQAHGPIDNAFRAMLAAAGATIVSYIPNDAYLVRATPGQIVVVAGNPETQTVIPYEPYYKVQAPLLAYDRGPLPEGTALNLGLFGDDVAATIQEIQNLGGQIFAQDTSPFGIIVRVIPPENWTALATLPGVQIVEPYHKRVIANDLARVTLGIATNTTTSTNYMNLSGSNVMVEVNDTGIDANHPDFTQGGSATKGPGVGTRVTGDAPQSLDDTDGHGTHVAGIIAGNGAKSSTINTGTNIPPGSVTNADFRGKAPNATLFSVGGIVGGNDTNIISDSYLQAEPALTNALISNNSWGNGDEAYDLASASYDAAVRDALPFVPGSQPVLFVFAAGNDGAGDNAGGEGTPDSISSPATAKNVVTVGALEQLRNITNYVTAANGTSNQIWLPMTDTSYEVADYSSRGNVGIGTEGTFGRFKPDVVAPGTFVVSTRSEQWNQAAYYNPTNVAEEDFPDQAVATNTVNYYNIDLSTTTNVVGITIEVVSNEFTTGSLNLPIYVSSTPSPDDFPDPTMPGTYFVETNTVSIPPNGGAGYLANAIASGGFNYAVGNGGTQPANYDLIVEITTTNELGNYFTVLSNLNNTLGPWYRYETGTSMAAPAVSGVLALMQDYFTNTLHALPSPALMKAMVINGARTTGFYDLQVQNSMNFEGWGLANLPDSLPPGVTNSTAVSPGTSAAMFIFDQSPTNALATGDSRTLFVTVSSNALTQPLRVTLAWTDPPGNPAAAIKLVNNLDLVVTNLNNPSIVYYGNDISTGDFNNQESTNLPPVFDAINNVQNVYLPADAGTNFSVTVMGYRVNVNAVSAQTNNSAGMYAPNVVQDYALVISSGNGQMTNALTVTNNIPIVSNPTGDQQITYYVSTNGGALLNQTVGANSPLLGTNTISFNQNAPENLGTNWQITIGQTDQWHFYVVTNTTSFTNAAFITFDPDTLAIPRMGVFADSQGNATQPEADIDLYATTDPTLTNLNPIAISNAVMNGMVSLSRGGTEFVVFSNSMPREVYYVGVKSETQEASEYAFLPIFSATPFSVMQNGVESMTGVPLDALIPGGNPAVPGFTNVVALATYPIQTRTVVVSNMFYTESFGDLVGAVNHNDTSVILNNHDSINTPGTYSFTYDDSGENDIAGSQPSDGPGSLNSFIGTDGLGVWILHETDDAEGFSNVVDSFNVTIQPQEPEDESHTNFIANNGSFLDYVNVPPGATNLTITVTNITMPPSPSLELFVKYGAPPTTNDFDEMVLITNVDALGLDGTISIVPPMVGVYYFAVVNTGATIEEAIINVNVGLGTAPAQTIYSSSGPVPLLDDAVTTNNIAVTANQIVSSVDVALRVEHPRVSDLVFHLISPDGTRDLLVENRGGETTSGMGVTLTSSNTVAQAQTSSGGPNTSTNVINTGQASGTLTVEYNFYTLPDEMVVYDASNNLIFDSGFVSDSGVFNIAYTNSPLTIIMNPDGNPGGAGDLWEYTVEATGPVYEYLVLTENTNLTTTPIKFAPPPFVPGASSATNISDFETAAAGDSVAPADITDESIWSVLSNQVTVVDDPINAQAGNQFLALANGTISNTLATVAGQTYTLTFDDRGPGIAGWWRGESNAVDSIGGNIGTFPNGMGFAPGEVGTGFNLNGTSQFLLVNPVSPGNLDIGQGSGFTIEGWIKPTTLASQMCVAEYESILGGVGTDVGIDFYINYPTGTEPGCIYANIVDTGNAPHQIVSPTNLLTAGVWQHIALSYKKASGVATLYLNGVAVTQTNLGTFTPQTSYTNLLLGARTAYASEAAPADAFSGDMDEMSIYNRALSDSEIKAIYTDGTAGKFNLTEFSTSPSESLSKAEVSINGGTPTTFFGNNTSWQAQSATFTATQTGTPLVISGLEPGMLLDSFTLSEGSGDLYYLPEQSLDTFAGENANGEWTLEVQDDRAGATNPAPSLLSWQLRFNFTTPVTPASSIGTLTNGVPVTNTIPANSIAYYLVNVPTNAIYATNSLSLTNGPLTLWFNETTPPSGTNSPGDILLFTTSSNALAILSTNSTPTNIVPGGSYYLAVQNTNTYAVTNYDLEVNFDLVVPPPTPPVTNFSISGIVHTNIGGTNGFLLEWYAPTNDLFQVQWTGGLAMPVWLAFTNIVSYTGPITPTNGLFTFFDTGSEYPFGPFRFYRLILLGSLNSTLTNGVPQTNTIAANSTAYYLISVPTNADDATNSLSVTGGPLNLWFNETTPPTGTNAGDYLLFTTSGNDFTVLSTTSTPTNIVPGGSYYLAVQNTNSFAVSNYTLQVSFNLAPAAAITNYPISSIVYTNIGGMNGVLLTWTAPTNDQFQIQWTTGLASGLWTTVPDAAPALVAVTGTTGTYQWFDNGSLTGGFGRLKFYRLIAYPPGVAVPPLLVISSVEAFAGGGVQIQWSGSTNYLYDIRWTTSLALPTSSWNVISNLLTDPEVTYAGGVFTFDDPAGAQTGGAAAAKFFQVVELP